MRCALSSADKKDEAKADVFASKGSSAVVNIARKEDVTADHFKSRDLNKSQGDPASVTKSTCQARGADHGNASVFCAGGAVST